MELHFQTYGQGLPLVILHGLFGMLDNWHTVSRMLANHFNVFAVDQRNHGRSPHSPDFNYQALADDTRDFIVAHKLAPSHILGHSMGGKTAMWTALRYPEVVERLIVVDIAPHAYSSMHDEILAALNDITLESYSSRSEIDGALALKMPDFAVRQFLMKNLTRKEDGGYRWKMNLPVITSHYQEIISSIQSNETFQKPTLFIRSQKSSYVRDEDIPDIKKLFPLAEIVSFDTGHWVHAEAPVQLTKTVTEFLLQ